MTILFSTITFWSKRYSNEWMGIIIWIKSYPLALLLNINGVTPWSRNIKINEKKKFIFWLLWQTDAQDLQIHLKGWPFLKQTLHSK